MAISKDKLPRNIEAEKATLGAMLTSSTAKDQCLAILNETDFFLKSHQIIFVAIYNVNQKNIKVDIQTVTQELQNLKALEDIGSVDYLYELTQSMLSLDNVEEYAEIVKANANARELLTTLGNIENDFLTKDVESYTSFVGDAQRRINLVADKRKISNFTSSREEADHVKHQIFEIAENFGDNQLTGVDTGFRDLNKFTNGLQNESLIIVAGRPGCGKTAFALNLLLNAAKITKRPVAIFEMEMSPFLLYTRLVSSISYVPMWRIQQGKIDAKAKGKIVTALDLLSELKIYVDETASLTLIDLCAKARKLKKEQPDLAMIAIDYLGLIASDSKRRGRNDSRQLEIQEYTRALHELARELHIPIVLLCQLNRKIEDRGEGSTPKLSDLRESGSIEQDAEMVLLLHRDDYGKNALTEARKDKAKAAHMSDEARKEMMNHIQNKAIQEKAGDNNPIMNVIIAKNRNGISDQIVKLVFQKEYSHFEDTTQDFVDREKQLAAKYSEEE